MKRSSSESPDLDSQSKEASEHSHQKTTSKDKDTRVAEPLDNGKGVQDLVSCLLPNKIIKSLDLKPSQRTEFNCDETWLWAQSDKYRPGDIDHSKVGKWMLFVNNAAVDGIWARIKASVLTGTLYSSKVSWLSAQQKTHAIMIYTVDYEDLDDVIRVLDHLEETGVKPRNRKIYYKTDNQTRAEVYRGTSHQKPWIYCSDDVRNLRLRSKGKKFPVVDGQRPITFY